jgi:hypothetical protein
MGIGKITLYCLVFLLFLGCRSSLQEIKSTKQHWCLTDKGIYGINYHFTFKAFKDYKELKLDSIFIHNKWINNFHYSVLGKSNTEQNFTKGDTILISLNILDTLKSESKIIITYTTGKRNHKVFINKLISLKNLCP